MDNIILIGMPSSGRSTLGRQLAARLGYAYLDTDDVIKRRNGCQLQDILDRDGMDVFKQREEEAVCSVQAAHTVIATGGSVVYSPRAMAHLHTLGRVVYLAISYETLLLRVGDPRVRGIAIAPGRTFRDLYEERVPLYRRYADCTLEETGGEAVACSVDKLAALLKD